MYLYLFLLVFSWAKALQIGAPFNLTIQHASSRFGPQINGTIITGKLTIANPYSTCGEIMNDVMKRFVLVEKQTRDKHCDYASLVYKMQQRGAIGVIVADHEKRHFLESMNSKKKNITSKIVIPSVFIKKTSSFSLLTYLSVDSGFNVTIDDEGKVTLENVRKCITLYVVIVFILWGGTILFYSDCCIVRRILSQDMQCCRQMKYSLKCSHESGVNPTTEIGDECSICLESFREEDRITVIRCNHYFHTECINPWLKKYCLMCPICKIHVIDRNGSSERKLHAEMKRQQWVYSFWRNFLILNGMMILFSL